MKGSVATSIGLHVAILAIALFGLPRPDPYKIKPQEAIQVDISKIGDTQKKMAMAKDAEEKPVKPAPKKTEKIAKPEPQAKAAEEVKKVAKEQKSEPQPEPVKKEEPKPLDPDPLKDLIKDSVTAEDDAAKLAEKKAEDKKLADKKKADEKKKLADAEKKRAEKKKVAEAKKKALEFDPDAIAETLRDLNLDKENEEKTTNVSETATIDGAPTRAEANLQGTDDQLVGTIVDALVGKVRQCWNVPPGAREADLTIRVHFQLNQDGTVNGTPQVENASADPIFDATARSAVAALMECQAYDLPRERYDLWKDNTLDFNPNLMFQG